ncbi:Gfo/Idh/MocA family protein [Prochlorococcus marinus]|uniref:Gfo/Idh/MocA family protein n=1 Tax=Prochlorococcus marinus TaxID=1219 RepID=UPI0022B2E2AC|nr:Gfo/Idh/MocA family oxidoreductase [Prochlorococcus marinus]
MKKKKKNEDDLPEIGLIGLGRWGKNMLAACQNISCLKLKCVASKNPDAKELIPKDCEIYLDWREMITYQELDGVIICTPPNTHLEIAQNFIKARIPILIEKPLTLNLNEAKSIYKIAKYYNSLVVTDFIHLFNYKFKALKDSLKLIGDIKYILTKAGNFGPYRKDTPVLWDWGAHDLSMLISLMGQSPNKISTKKIRENKTRKENESIWQINCSFDNQIESSTLIGNMMPRCRKMGVLGSNGMLVFDDIETTPLKFYKNWTCRNFPSKGGISIPVLEEKEPVQLVIESFLDLINNDINHHWSLSLGVEICRLLKESSI